MKKLDAVRLEQVLPTPPTVDSHIHLDSAEYAEDLDACIQRARQMGVQIMQIPSTDLSSSQRILELTQRHPELRGALGIHPHQAASYAGEETWNAWRSLLQAGRWSAVGETGLECHYDFCPLSVQTANLEANLQLSREAGLPVILHCRQAEQPLYDILRCHPESAGVVHCFTGDWEWAVRFLDLGFYLGVGGLVTLPKAEDVREVARRVPGDRWLLETDGPYLSPAPLRGYRNESSLLPLVVRQLAELRKVSIDEVCAQSVDNFHRLFGP